MALRAHLIIYNARNVHILPEVDEALQQRRYRIGGRLGIDHEHHGQPQHPGNLGRRAPITVVAVEQPHHALHDTDVGISPVVGEELSDVVGGGHKRVEVDTRATADCLMKLGVDIVGTALEGLHPHAL